jgi:hypothetical protein
MAKNTDIDLNVLIDAYAEAHEKAAEWAKKKEDLRVKLLPYCSITEVLSSEKYAISYSEGEFEKLDTEKIRLEMDAKWMKKYTEKGVRKTIKVTNLKKAAKRAAS